MKVFTSKTERCHGQGLAVSPTVSSTNVSYSYFELHMNSDPDVRGGRQKKTVHVFCFVLFVYFRGHPQTRF